MKLPDPNIPDPMIAVAIGQAIGRLAAILHLQLNVRLARGAIVIEDPYRELIKREVEIRHALHDWDDASRKLLLTVLYNDSP